MCSEILILLRNLCCSLKALETVKILSGMDACYSGSLFLFDGLEGKGRLVKLRGRREGVEVTFCYLCSLNERFMISNEIFMPIGDRVDRL